MMSATPEAARRAKRSRILTGEPRYSRHSWIAMLLRLRAVRMDVRSTAWPRNARRMK
jgi:hypothetical protein